MEFTAEEQAKFERIFKGLRGGVAKHAKLRKEFDEEFKSEQITFECVFYEKQHVKDRFDQLMAMSDEEVMQEVIADCVIYGDCLKDADEDFLMNYNSFQKSYDNALYKHIRMRFDAIRQNPTLLSHVPAEDLFIWDRLNQLLSRSDKEIREDIEADGLLFSCVAANEE